MKKAQKILALISLILVLACSQQIQCSLRCTQCATPTSCSACQQGFFLVNQTFCSPCPTGCTSCRPGANGIPICTECAPPAQLNTATGKCFLCNPSCLTCANTPQNCVTCATGLILETVNNTGVCVRPVTDCTIQNCNQCSAPDLMGNYVCNICSNGYFLFREGCAPCRYPCLSCNFDRLQVWNSQIAPMWTGVFAQMANAYTPNTMPPVANVDISTLSPQQIKDWTEASFVVRLIHQNNMHDIPIENITSLITIYSDQTIGLQMRRSQALSLFNTIAQVNLNETQFTMKLANIAANSSNCLQCLNGFEPYIVDPTNTSMTNTQPPQCMPCSPGCLSCANLACSICQDGFYLDTTLGLCKPCVSPCLNCLSQTTCTKCYAPLSLSSTGTCNLCLQTCATCSPTNSSYCQSCKQPFSKTPNLGVCFRCVQDLCNQCLATDNSTCLECRLGATLMNGKCSLCPINCATCSPATPTTNATCFICKTGFQLGSDGKCISCSPGCLSCSETNASICLECLPGAFLNTTSGKCQRCKQGCLLCTSYETCTQLEWGQVQINSEVVKCRPGCKYCSSTNSAICTQCQPRYFLSSNNCFPCGPGCQTCTSGTLCTKCLTNLNLAAGICTQCISSCKTCSPSNPTSCLTCKRGYTLFGSQCLHQCSTGCLQCDANDVTICKVCAQGHALKSDGTCVKCVQSCRGTCDASNINICLSCLNGFQLKQNKCVRCPSGCSTCLNGQCLTCLQGYTLYQNSAGSFVCNIQCKFPCSQCTETSCTKCAAGYTMTNRTCQPSFSCNPSCDFCPVGTERDPITNNCVACPVGCGACASGTCIQCIDGFFKNSNGECVPCTAQCRTCYGEYVCKQCAPGFVKQVVSMVTGTQDATYSDQCVSCSSNCKTCAVEPQRCTSCNTGFRLYFYRCAGVFNVVYKYEINQDYNQFLANSQSQRFIDVIANQTGLNIKDIYINQIKSGSTIISGSMSSQNKDSASNLQRSLPPSVPGFSVLSSSAAVYLQDTPYQQQQIKAQGSKDLMLGAIIGGTVGGLVLIGVIVFVVCKFRAKNRVQPQTQLKNYDQIRVNNTQANLDQYNHKNQVNVLNE